MDQEDLSAIETSVYVSKRLAEKLYVFQYFNKFPTATLLNNKIEDCAIKSNSQEVKLDVALKINSVNYDADKGKEIAVKCDGAFNTVEKNVTPFFNSDKMNKICYTGSKAFDNCSSYAVGLINQSGIHLTPLKGIIHLKPNFEYIDKTEKRQKSKKQVDTDENNEATPVTVRIARASTSKKMNEQSFAHFTRKIAEEPWCQTVWHHLNSTKADLERMNLVSADNQDVGHALNLPHSVYLEHLIPPPIDSHKSQTENKKNLLEQCKELLKNAQIVTFDEICTHLNKKENFSKSDILQVVIQTAVLVKGLWIAQSELIYPPKTFSPKEGVPAEYICTVRDYMLYQFIQNEYVARKDILEIMHIPLEELKDMLSGIADQKPGKGWFLKLQPDNDFIKKYPDVVKRQSIWWESKAKGKQFKPNNETTKEINCKSPKKRKLSNKDVNSEIKINGVHRRDSLINSDSENDTTKKRKR